MNCIFCKIIAKQIPATVIAETETIFVIEDIAPKFPVHYLIIPKEHRENISALNANDTTLAADILFMAQTLSQQLAKSGKSSDFRLLFNNGTDAGQSVLHLHAHFLSGKKVTDF